LRIQRFEWFSNCQPPRWFLFLVAGRGVAVVTPPDHIFHLTSGGVFWRFSLVRVVFFSLLSCFIGFHSVFRWFYPSLFSKYQSKWGIFSKLTLPFFVFQAKQEGFHLILFK
jgi:hypothetical protein